MLTAAATTAAAAAADVDGNINDSTDDNPNNNNTSETGDDGLTLTVTLLLLLLSSRIFNGINDGCASTISNTDDNGLFDGGTNVDDNINDGADDVCFISGDATSLDESESSLALSCRPSVSTGLAQFDEKADSFPSSGSFDSGTNENDNIDDGAYDGAEKDDNRFLR